MKIEEVLKDNKKRFRKSIVAVLALQEIKGVGDDTINLIMNNFDFFTEKTLQQQEKDIKADILEKVEEYIKEERESVMSELADSQTELVGDKIKDIIKEV